MPSTVAGPWARIIIKEPPNSQVMAIAVTLPVLFLVSIMALTPVASMAAPSTNRNQDNPSAARDVGACIPNEAKPNTGKLAEPALMQARLGRELQVGESRIIEDVCPQEKFFPTSILVTPGATYEITAFGRWKDSWIKTGPEGWWFLPFHPFNRIPWHRMFILSGSVGPSLEHVFIIGKHVSWTAPKVLPTGMAAELQLFPNDWDSKYNNNASLPASEGGPMRVTILRKS